MRAQTIILLGVVLLVLISPALAGTATITIFGTNASNAQANLTNTGNQSINVTTWNVGGVKTFKVNVTNVSDTLTFNLYNVTAGQVNEFRVNNTAINGYQADSNGLITFTRTQGTGNSTFNLAPAVQQGGYNATWAYIQNLVVQTATTIYNVVIYNATQVQGDGSGLTNLNRSNVTGQIGVDDAQNVTEAALQANDTYFNGTVFPQSTEFKNSTAVTANNTANTANTTANNAVPTALYSGNFPNATVAGNLGNWNATYNSTYAGTTSTVNGNLANWNSTYNATYDAKPSSTFNSTYDVTTSTVNGNLANWNATYNATYDAKEPAISQGVSPQFWMFNKTWQNITTTWVTEGVNLWFTNTRAISAVQTILDAMNTSSQGRDDSINSSKLNKTDLNATVNFYSGNASNLTGVLPNASIPLSAANLSANNTFTGTGNTSFASSVGIGTTIPFTDVAGGTTDFTGRGLHIKNTAEAQLLTEGNAVRVTLIDSGGLTNDKIIDFLVDGGVAFFRSLNDDLSLRTDSILVMDLGNGNVGFTNTTPGNIISLPVGSATDPIADSWLTYSTPKNKIVLGEADKLTEKYRADFRNTPVYRWKRTTNEPERLGVLAQVGTPPEILAYHDGKNNTNSTAPNATIQGIDLGAYIGWLHEIVKGQDIQLQEQELKIASLEARVQKLEEKDIISAKQINYLYNYFNLTKP